MNLDGPWPDWLPKSPEHILNRVVCWVECCSINSWNGWSASICCCVVRTVTWLPIWSKMADVFWTVHRPEWVGRKTVMSLTANDCPSASKATLMNMDKYFMWIHYERLHNHNKAKHNKTVCIFLGKNCTWFHMDVDEKLNVWLHWQCPDNVAGVCCVYGYEIYASRQKMYGVICKSPVMSFRRKAFWIANSIISGVQQIRLIFIKHHSSSSLMSPVLSVSLSSSLYGTGVLLRYT